MPLFRRLFACLALGLAMASSLPAAGIEVPPITGELSGEFRPLILPDAPPLAWKLALRAGASTAERQADFTVEGPGLRATGEVRLTKPTEGTWRLTGGEVDLERWFTVLAAKYFPDFVGLSVTGKMVVSGDGILSAGQPMGRIAFELKDAAVSDPLKGWAIEGVVLAGTLPAFPKLATESPVTIAIKAATMVGVTARDISVTLTIEPGETVNVTQASAALFDGRVALGSFQFPLRQPAFDGEVQFESIEIAGFKELLPPMLAHATGRMSGRVGLKYSPAEGLAPGKGRLQIDAGSAVNFRLAPQPGFLTSRMPPRLYLFKEPQNWFTRALSIANPAYPTLKGVEEGEIELAVNELDIGLTPEGDSEGRTARVVLATRPQGDTAVKNLNFEFNVNGPLADLMRLGVERKMELNIR